MEGDVTLNIDRVESTEAGEYCRTPPLGGKSNG